MIPLGKRSKQSGFSLVTALFILVVLGSLGTYMMTISGIQQQTTNFSLLSARAYQAARSGVEWGIYRVVTDGACFADKTISFTEVGLNGFETVVNCSSTSHQEKSSTFNIYNLTAISKTGSFGSLNFVSREIAITITDVVP